MYLFILAFAALAVVSVVKIISHARAWKRERERVGWFYHHPALAGYREHSPLWGAERQEWANYHVREAWMWAIPALAGLYFAAHWIAAALR